MKVRIPTPLRSYTGEAAVVEVDAPAGCTVAAVLEALDVAYPGIRFRMVDEHGRLRQHMRIWIDADPVRDLGAVVPDRAEVTIMQALSGGA